MERERATKYDRVATEAEDITASVTCKCWSHKCSTLIINQHMLGWQ